jgi:spore cortex formation protein SpoVR/YcgB (stage V sporulation)
MTSQFEDQLVPEFSFWDEHLRRVFKRMGGLPYPPNYRFFNDDEMEDALAYVGFPIFPGTWRNGKHFVQSISEKLRTGQGGSPYELILNTDPSYIWMKKTTTMGYNTLIIGHATCGHSHFFRNNYRFKDTKPKEVMQRFAQIDARFQELANDPKFGVDRLEYTLDAAMVLEQYCRRDDDTKAKAEKVRARLEEQLRKLQSELENEGSGFRAELLGKRIATVKARLARDPINKVRNIGEFFLDEKHNPGLSKEEREIIEAVFYIAAYFAPQRETKFMNEGFASWCEEKIPKDPQACLPINYWAELANAWTMFYKAPMKKYEDPYTLSTDILFKIDRERCHYADEPIECDVPVFDEVDDPTSAEARREAIYNPGQAPKSDYEVPMDRTGIMRNTDNKIVRFTGKYRKGLVPNQDLKPLFDVVANYRDTSFFREFLTHDVLNELNDESMRWIAECFRSINQKLRENGWNPAMIKKVPMSIVGKLEIVEEWMSLAQNSQQMHGDMGSPIFPAPRMLLDWMAEILQLVAGYQADKETFRQGMIFKLTAAVWYTPDIAVIDGGASSEGDGTLVLEHQYDALTGFLKPSWTRESLKLLQRLWKRGTPIKLLTKEGEVNEQGEATSIVDYFYVVDSNGKLTEGEVPNSK